MAVPFIRGEVVEAEGPLVCQRCGFRPEEGSEETLCPADGLHLVEVIQCTG